MAETHTIHLRDYLSPGGRYPYAKLSVDMGLALENGKDVVVLSVPGFLMVRGSADLAKEGRRAWCADGKYYVTPYEALRGIDGKRNPTKIKK